MLTLRFTWYENSVGHHTVLHRPAMDELFEDATLEEIRAYALKHKPATFHGSVYVRRDECRNDGRGGCYMHTVYTARVSLD